MLPHASLRACLTVMAMHPRLVEMTPTENPQTEASYHTAAVARWHHEGGASKFASRKKGADVLKKNTDAPGG
jgi:hypothetical protein